MSGATEGEPGAGRSAADWLEAVRHAERRGELLAGFDLASRGLEEHPGHPDLRYRAVLALARAGSTGEAARQFVTLDVAAIATADAAALWARIQKDEALAAEGDERRRLAGVAADLYSEIRDTSGDYYPAINAATLTLVAGRPAAAADLARQALELVAVSGDDSYYAAATVAEARLLLGDPQGAGQALARAVERHDGDYGALATTRRQLRLVCRLAGLDEAVLAPLAGPAVAHVCGHRVAGPDEEGRFTADQEAEVVARVAALLDAHPVGAAYGSLASGADVLWFEAVLERGGEIHVVLPFELREFLAVSVAPSGLSWVVRARACLARASSVTYVTEDAYLGDDALFRYCSDSAMGLALLRARFLDAEVRQLAVWDGRPPDGPAGTAADVLRWQGTGRRSVVVRPDGRLAGAEPLGPAAPERLAVAPADGSGRPRRVLRAMLFGDIRGFSKLTDPQLPGFAELVLGTFADVLTRYGDQVEHANTWGDALFAVLSSAPVAARCALELQEQLGQLDFAAAGLPGDLALRLSGHVGPVFPLTDPVLGRRAFMGAHVSRTARIEPVTPPGAVYVTEAFAAALELEGDDDVRCDYVGHLPAAKDYGRLRMYRMRRPTVRASA